MSRGSSGCIEDCRCEKASFATAAEGGEHCPEMLSPVQNDGVRVGGQLSWLERYLVTKINDLPNISGHFQSI
jgi:hypothetical protein